MAMDFRAAGQLFVATREGSTKFFYTVDPNTGSAVKVNFSFSSNWSGNFFGLDFPPTPSPGRATLVSDLDQIQSADESSIAGPYTVAYDNTTSDGDPVDEHAGDNPAIAGLAFTNSFPEAKATVLYGIDATPNALVTVNRFSGQLNTVGPLGEDTGPRCGFDISGVTGIAYAALSSGDDTILHTVDLGTGTAASVGHIGTALTGFGLIDIAVLPPTRLVNISTRTRVGIGEDVMIAGFTTVGRASSRLIIRGLGPSLAAFGIASPLPNPYLSVRDHNGVAIASNDNWKTSQQTEITQSQLAPTNDLEAAYIGNFAPGAYTAILLDATNETGVGVIEVYKLSDQ